MADFKGHFQAGIIVATLASLLGFFVALSQFRYISLEEIPIIFSVTILGALWPDTDIGSKSQRYVYTFFLIIDVVLIFYLQFYKEAAFFGLFTMLPSLSPHRGWTHSFRANLVVGLLWLVFPLIGQGFLVRVIHVHHFRDLIFVGVPYYLAFLMGVLSHLILDRHSYFKKKRRMKKKSHHS